MASSTPYQSLPFPDPTDPDDVPADIQGLAEAVDGKLVMVFSTSGTRDAAIGAPTHGMVAYLQDEKRLSIYQGGEWRKGTLVQAGLDAARPSATAVPEGTIYYETNTNLLKLQVGSAWIIANATGDVGGSDVDASAVVINGTEKKLHEITLPANPDYAMEVFLNGYASFGGGGTADDLELRLRLNGTGGTMLARGKDRTPANGWGSVAISETRTIAKGASAADRTFTLTILGSAANGHTTMNNPNAVGIDYVAIPKNL